MSPLNEPSGPIIQRDFTRKWRFCIWMKIHGDLVNRRDKQKSKGRFPGRDERQTLGFNAESHPRAGKWYVIACSVDRAGCRPATWKTAINPVVFGGGFRYRRSIGRHYCAASGYSDTARNRITTDNKQTLLDKRTITIDTLGPGAVYSLLKISYTLTISAWFERTNGGTCWDR